MDDQDRAASSRDGTSGGAAGGTGTGDDAASETDSSEPEGEFNNLIGTLAAAPMIAADYDHSKPLERLSLGTIASTKVQSRKVLLNVDSGAACTAIKYSTADGYKVTNSKNVGKNYCGPDGSKIKHEGEVALILRVDGKIRKLRGAIGLRHGQVWPQSRFRLGST